MARSSDLIGHCFEATIIEEKGYSVWKQCMIGPMLEMKLRNKGSMKNDIRPDFGTKNAT